MEKWRCHSFITFKDASSSERGVDNMQDSGQMFIEDPLIWKYKKRYILGTDEFAAAIFIELCTRRVYVHGFIDDQNAGIHFFHKPVYASGEVDLEDEDVILLSNEECDRDVSVKFQMKEMQAHYMKMPSLESKKIWVDKEYEIVITPGVVAQLEEYTTYEHIKEIILYGNNLSLARKCAEVLECLDFVPITIMADEKMQIEEGVYSKAIEEVRYKEDYLILVYERDVKDLFRRLSFLGVDKGRYGKVCPWVSPNFNTRNPLLDVHMGYTYEMNSDYPGIQMYGRNQRNDFRIAVLGDSTTDGAIDVRIRPWAEIMYDWYCGNGITIFNGGMSGYYSGQELIKLKRDMLKLCPDLIIVYDGYNDLMQSVLHKKFGYLEKLVNVAGQYVTEADGRVLQQKKAWGGIPSSQSPVDEWLENIECMHAIAANKKISFFSFMQPMLFTKKNLDWHSRTILQTMLFHGNNDKFMKYAKEFRSRAGEIVKSHGYIHDLTNIFDDEDVYMDIVHVYEKGNEIIASSIWNVIKDEVEIRKSYVR